MTEESGRGSEVGGWAPPPEDLVDLKTAVRRDQLDWLERLRAVRSDPSLDHTLRRILDQGRQDEDVLAARAHAVGYAALATELAQTYQRDRQAATGDIPGEDAA